MSEELSIENEKINEEYLFMSFRGSINMDTCDIISARIQELTAAITPQNYIFDFKNVDFLSSSGIEVFLTVLNEADDKEGKVVLVSMPAEVQRIFSLVGLLDEFLKASSKEGAIRLLE